MSCAPIHVINLSFPILNEDRKTKGETELGYKFVYHFLTH